MKTAFRIPTPWVVLLGAAGVAAVVSLSWPWIALSSALLFAEQRPALLRDAAWSDPSSAQRFQARFGPGVPERELTAWLRRNDFAVGPAGHASKLIHSLPCDQVVSVAWESGPAGRLRQASAQVAEAGCL